MLVRLRTGDCVTILKNDLLYCNTDGIASKGGGVKDGHAQFTMDLASLERIPGNQYLSSLDREK